MFKRKFLSSAVLSSHCACVYIYIQCTVITFSIERTMPCEEKKERKKVKILNGRQGRTVLHPKIRRGRERRNEVQPKEGEGATVVILDMNIEHTDDHSPHSLSTSSVY